MRIQLQHEHRQIRGAERASDDGIREHPEEPHAQVYTSPMPVDLDAAVIANTRLSADYNVVSLAAPAIAALASPGQFVMVKPARGTDPLLRRPFSIFEILRDASGESTGISILNKRIGVGTGRLYEVEPGAHVAVLGPLGRPFEPIAPPAEAWMIAGGVGLAPFLTLSEALREVGTPSTLFYGARRRSELYTWRRSSGSASAWCWQPRTAAGECAATSRTARRCTECLRAAAARWSGSTQAVRVRAYAHDGGSCETGGRPRASLRCLARTDHGLRVGRVLQLRRAGATRAADASFRPIVHRRSGARCHADRLGGPDALMDLTVSLGALTLANPLIAASGCFGYGVEYADVVDLSSLGGVAVKGLFLNEREGHVPPRIVETPSGMLNAIGLQGIGVHRFVREKLPELRDRRAVVFVNICGTTIDEYVELARILSDAEGVAALELNISCPNIKEGGHHFRLQPDRHSRSGQRRPQGHGSAGDTQADPECHRRRFVRAVG